MVTGTATRMDGPATVIEATETETEAKATDMAAVKVAMGDKARMEALTTLDLLLQLQLQTRMPKPPTITHSMPNGPLTMLRIRPKTHTLHMVVGQQSWLNTHRVTVRTM